MLRIWLHSLDTVWVWCRLDTTFMETTGVGIRKFLGCRSLIWFHLFIFSWLCRIRLYKWYILVWTDVFKKVQHYIMAAVLVITLWTYFLFWCMNWMKGGIIFWMMLVEDVERAIYFCISLLCDFCLDCYSDYSLSFLSLGNHDFEFTGCVFLLLEFCLYWNWVHGVFEFWCWKGCQLLWCSHIYYLCPHLIIAASFSKIQFLPQLIYTFQKDCSRYIFDNRTNKLVSTMRQQSLVYTGRCLVSWGVKTNSMT